VTSFSSTAPYRSSKRRRKEAHRARGEDFAPRKVWVDEFVLPRNRIESWTLYDGSFRRPAEALQLSVLAFMVSMAHQGKMKQVSLAQARDRLSMLVNDAAHGGQRIVLASRGRPKAALIGMEDLARLERAETGTTTIEREMLHWIERVEDAQRHWPRAARSSTQALREVREAEHAGRNGVRRREPRAQAARRRGR